MFRYLVASFTVSCVWVDTTPSAVAQTQTTASSSAGQATSSTGPGVGQVAPGLASPPRPTFGDRPVGQGFRPAMSSGRPGLLRSAGLQDAMRAARLSPLYPGNLESAVTTNTDPELTQALQTLRNLRDVRSRQIAAQGSRQRRRAPVLNRVVITNLPVPPPANPAAIRDRIVASLENLAEFRAELTIRHDGDAIVLEGVVESEAQRDVIEQLIRLEPGVYDVDNRLRVEPTR